MSRYLAALLCALLCALPNLMHAQHVAMDIPFAPNGLSPAAWSPSYSYGGVTGYPQGQWVTRNTSLCFSLKFANTGDPATDTTDWACSAPAITLQTNGTSGPATYANGTLNIPQYAGGSAPAGYTDTGSSFATGIAACSASQGIQVSQGVTVSSSVTIPAACAVKFVPGGELLPASGVTITLSKGTQVQAPENQQIFGGAGTIAGMNQLTPAAWFGAFPDTGADQTAALNAAVAACSPYGCDVSVKPGTYRTSAAIVMPPSAGIIGPPLANSSSPQTVIQSTSASADIFSVQGGYAQRIENLAIGRSLVPSSGSKGIDCNNESGYLFRNLWVADSYSDLYYHACPSGYQGTYNVSAVWGQYGVSGYPSGATLSGFELDSSDGTAENSIILSRVGAGYQPSGASVTQLYVHGSAINDLNIDGWNGSGTNHGMVVTYTGNGANDTGYDLHFNHMTFDGCAIDCVSITGTPANGSTVIGDLYTSAASSSPIVSLTNAYNVNMQAAEISNGGAGGGVLVSGGGNNILQGFQFQMVNGGNYALLSGTTGNQLSNFTFDGTASNGNSFLAFVNGSTHNNVTNLNGVGPQTYGLYFSANSTSNSVLGYYFPQAPMNDLSNGQNTTSVSAGSTLTGTYSCPTATPYVTAISFSGGSANVSCTSSSGTTGPATNGPTYASVTLLADYDATKITGLSSGSKLTSWTDSSSNGNTITAPSANAPTYQAAGFGGGTQAGVVFSAASTSIMTGNFLPSSGAVTICATISNPTTVANSDSFAALAGFGTQLRDGVFSSSNGPLEAFQGTVLSGYNSNMTFNGTYGVCYVNNGANSALYEKAASTVTTATGSDGTATTPTGGFFLGGYTPSGGDYFGGTVGELLVFNGAATSADAQAILNNLQTKFTF